MKLLVCSCTILLSSYLLASDLFEGPLSIMMQLRQPHTQPTVPEKSNGQIFRHAEVAPSGVAVPSEAEALTGVPEDPVNILNSPNRKILENGAVSGALEEFKAEETREDLQQYGPMASQIPNEDESLGNADLDLKLSSSNPNASSTLRTAEPEL